MNFKLAAFADEADGSIDGQIKAMTENGIALLEIRGVDGQNIADISEKKALEVRSKLDNACLGVWSLGSPYGKIGINDDFDSHLEKFKRSLAIADILGAKHVRLFSFYGTNGEEKYKEQVLEKLSAFAKAAKGSDVLVCHENEKGIYGDMACRCLEIHQAIPEIKAIFDPANFIQSGQDTLEAWKLLSPYVEYMHIKDAKADGHVVPAGKGIGNLPYLLKEYKGQVLTLEPHLSVFEGFEKLEAGEKTKMEYTYPSSRAAFDAAVDALKGLIEK
ncbi:MAG: sugar phosphate isomerase/epimerase [Treponema sp.]|nr:sugar phosphate isomerase/epimerase [Treponema sp.]